MIHSLIISEGEGRAGLDVDCCRIGTRGAADIAPQIVGRESWRAVSKSHARAAERTGGHTGDWRVVVGVLPNMLVLAELGGAQRQLDSDVVGRDAVDSQREGGRGSEEALHGRGKENKKRLVSFGRDVLADNLHSSYLQQDTNWRTSEGNAALLKGSPGIDDGVNRDSGRPEKCPVDRSQLPGPR